VTRQAWARFGAYAAVVTAGAWGFWVDHQQDRARCEARNDSIRVAVLIGAESLVAVAPEADPDRVDRYLSDLDERLDAATIDCT
jgi:hypothetical protein